MSCAFKDLSANEVGLGLVPEGLLLYLSYNLLPHFSDTKPFYEKKHIVFTFFLSFSQLCFVL